MKKHLVLIGGFLGFFMLGLPAYAQTTYDSTTLVDSNTTTNSTVNTTNTNNNNTTSTSTSTSTNTNTNINTSTNNSTNTNFNVNSGTQTINNNNVNTGTMTYNNNNVNSTTSVNTNNNINTGEMTNNNINTSVSNSVSEINSVNQNENNSTITQKIVQPPPTAIAPAMMSGGNSDLCTVGVSGSAQTQILGMAVGSTRRDENCERLKLSKTLFDMGMKVAAVATLCQDRRVFDAMIAAGTPCPYEGEIGAKAKTLWEQNPDKAPKPIKKK